MSSGGGMKISIHKESSIDLTHRVEMLGSMFEVPINDKLSVNLEGEIDLERNPWNVGLIVGPSGSGKTLVLENYFGKPENIQFRHSSVIDDFPDVPMEHISRVCQSVGFNTIPAWLRPYSVLSNGEKFRAEIAHRLASADPSGSTPILCDEFTSVVDRQVAQITSYNVGRYVRENKLKFVAASCHYDIIEWLDPDWILEPGNPIRLTWRSLRRSRPPINVSISRVKYETWNLFREFHYMSQDLNKAARCYGLYVRPTSGMDTRFHDSKLGIRPGLIQSTSTYISGISGDLRVPTDESLYWPSRSGSSRGTSEMALSKRIYSEGRIACMCGILHRPHPRVHDIMGFTRMVTLPDFQGLGLAMCLAGTVASAYKALGKRLHSYPNHPAWIRSYQRSKDWIQVKNSGDFSPKRGETSTVGGFGGKRCAVFMFVGSPMNLSDAEQLIKGE